MCFKRDYFQSLRNFFQFRSQICQFVMYYLIAVKYIIFHFFRKTNTLQKNFDAIINNSSQFCIFFENTLNISSTILKTIFRPAFHFDEIHCCVQSEFFSLILNRRSFSEYEFAKIEVTERGHRRLIYNGITYGQHRHYSDGSSILWRCTKLHLNTNKNKTRCNSLVWTEIKNGYEMIIKSRGIHKHQ